MAIGLGRLRLSPRTFWSMTPREFALAVAVLPRQGDPPDRASLGAMMTAYPDKSSKEQGHGR
jgi:uncharacterized phage protein (TIGR02216 family)